MQVRWKKLIGPISALVLIAAPFSLSQQTRRPVSPEARSILGDTSYRFELNLDDRGGVRINTLSTLQPLPDTMTLQLFRNDETSNSITLQAVSPPPGSPILYQSPSYAGRFDPSNGPYVAFEIQFPLGPGNIKSYRADLTKEELDPVSAGSN